MRRPPKLFLAMTIAMVVTDASAAPTPADRARAAAAASRARTSSSDLLLRNVINPGIGGGAVSTVDGSRTFTSNLSCRKTQNLLRAVATPLPSGDLALALSRDTNLDGSYDWNSTVPVVSGVCANGYITCAPGSWTGCTVHKWDVDASGNITATPGPMAQNDSCYCVNNSCGPGLVTANMNSILTHLGGGVVGALTTNDPRYGVASADIAGSAIVYSGSQTTACSASPTVTAQNYRTNPAAISGDAFAAASSSVTYAALAGSTVGSGRTEQTRACSIQRNITVDSIDYDDVVTAAGSFSSITSCGTDCKRYRIEGSSRCPPRDFTATFSIARPDRLRSVTITRLEAEDWVQARVDGLAVSSAGRRAWLTDGAPPGSCEQDGPYTTTPALDVTSTFATGGNHTIAARVAGGGGSYWGRVDVEIRVNTGCTTAETETDLCSGYAADSKCRLHREDVDGVLTYEAGAKTGLTPVPQTRLFGGASCTLSLTRPWFEKQRQYRCVVDGGAITYPDVSRGGYIIDNSTATVLADRTKNSAGDFVTSTRAFANPPQDPVDRCENVCKTRAPKVNNDAAPAGVVATLQNDPNGFNTFYHTCAASVCPLGPGETVITPCGCVDDFPEAFVMMQAVRLAGSDLVCTTR